MERPVEAPGSQPPVPDSAGTDLQGLESKRKQPHQKSPHLMCQTRFWGIAGALACAYFSYLAYLRLRDEDFFWAHDLWSLLTYGVWIALILGLLSETRCWRERIFFGLVFLNFTLGFVLSAWSTAPMSAVRDSREIALVIWALASGASLVTAFAPKPPVQAGSDKQPKSAE